MTTDGFHARRLRTTRGVDAKSAAACVLLAASTAASALDYTVALDADAGRLDVRVCGDVDRTIELRAGAGAAGRLMGATRERGAIAVDGSTILAEDWNVGECLTYRVDLDASPSSARAAALLDDDIWLLEPSAWLWREADPGATTLTLALTDGMAASLPWPATAVGGGDRYDLPARSAAGGALTAFGRLAHRTVEHGGRRIELAVLATPGSPRAERLLKWQTEASELLMQAYGRLPLPSTQVLVIPVNGSGDPVPWAQSNRSAGVALHFHVDARATLADLRNDWTAAHEYAHLMHPYLGSEGSWLAEGLASYYQNILRARTGLIDEADAWRSLYAGFGRGARARAGTALSQASKAMRAERGFMRIYWSGAAFWLEADIALRRSGVAGASVDAALASFARCCLPQRRPWSPAAFVAELDRGLDVDVFRRLFERYRQRTDFPELADASRALGLDDDGSIAHPTDGAAFSLRRSIMGRAGRP
jgi:hypothetical protein